MNAVVPLAGDSALAHYLEPLTPILAEPGVTELCLQRPFEGFVESAAGWQRRELPFASYEWAAHLSRLVAVATGQRITAEEPLLSASLPSGERVQIVLPPATTAGTVVFSIRRPSAAQWTLIELAARGVLAECTAAGDVASPADGTLRALYTARDWTSFLAVAVRARKNILVSGPTGAGKTTLVKALVAEMPSDERLVVIEDVEELSLARHANAVRLLYSKNGQGLARVTAKRLLEASLRLRPDRILLAELRGEEAYDYLRNVNSGHPGSVTSVHASSARLAFEQLALLVKESPGGRELERADIVALAEQVVDVVVQCGLEGTRRFVREVWVSPRIVGTL
ncbi:MAG: P-type DNA transfer ATPase VirB11 [Dehalococcoidia bacterium]